MLAGCLLAAASLLGCVPARPRDTLTIRLAQEPDNLNPFLSGMSVTQEVAEPVLSGLLGVDSQLNFFGELATQVPTLQNGLVRARHGDLEVDYPLRRHIQWQDGAPFSASDVVFTWRFVVDPKNRVIDRSGYDRIKTVEAVRPDLARVIFQGIYAPYLKLFGNILPAHLLANHADLNANPYNLKPIGTGPYKVSRWIPGDRIELVSNPHYFRGMPKIRRIVLPVIADDNTAFLRLKSGDLDVYQTVALPQLSQVRAIPGIVVDQGPSLLYEHLAFNTERAPTDEIVVRRAISLSIDRGVLAKRAYQGVYLPAYCDLVPLSWAYDPNLRGRFDPPAARRMLDLAGWVLGPDGIRHRGGRSLSLELLTTSGKKPREITALLIRDFLKAIGVEVRISTIPGSLLFSLDGPLKQGQFDIAMWAWDNDLDPDSINNWHSQRIPPRGSNSSRYRNLAVDRLLEQAESTVDRQKRRAAYRRVSRHLADDVPDLPLLYWMSVDARTDRLAQWKPGPLGSFWNSYAWYFRR